MKALTTITFEPYLALLPDDKLGRGLISDRPSEPLKLHCPDFYKKGQPDLLLDNQTIQSAESSVLFTSKTNQFLNNDFSGDESNVANRWFSTKMV